MLFFLKNTLHKVGRRYTGGLVLLVLLAIGPVQAQQNPYGFALGGHRNSLKVPFQLLSNLIIVPVLINHSADTLHFILDTGVSSTILFDRQHPVFKTMKPCLLYTSPSPRD